MFEYVMFGHSGRLGDYIDLVHAVGGQIKKIVVNVPDAPDPAGRSLVTRLDAYNAWRARWGIEDRVVVQELKDFSPAANERYILGFSGLGQVPMANYVAGRWGIEIDALVHPSAVISPTAELGRGCVVSMGCVVASESALGRLSWLGRGVTIGHDARIDEGAFIAPGVNLASAVHVGRGAAIGIGANVLEYLTLGEQCYVAGGAFVRSDVAPHTLVAGVPATVKKTLEPMVIPDVPAGVS